jgi:tetratricopeptide (TPR) repeat protein
MSNGAGMAKLLIQSMGCPNCGAPYEHETRNCRFCNSVLIVASLAETFERSLEKHQVAESLEKWRQRLKDDPDSAEAHFALGLSYLNSKLRDAALVHLRKAVLLAPEVADTHHNLAVTLLNDGNIEVSSPEYLEAVKEIDYSVQLAPDFGESVAFKHIFVARKLDAVDQTQALAEYRKAVDVCPDIATLQHNLGWCYLNLKNTAEAENCFQRAIDLDSGYHLAYSILCQIMFGQRKYERGIQLGMKAVSLMGPATSDETQAIAHSNLSLCLWMSHRTTEALKHAKKAIAYAPANPRFQQNLLGIQNVPRPEKDWDEPERDAANSEGTSLGKIVVIVLGIILLCNVMAIVFGKFIR